MEIKKIIKEELIKEGKRVKLTPALASNIDDIIDNIIPAKLDFLRKNHNKIKNGSGYDIKDVTYYEMGSKEPSLAKVHITSSNKLRWAGLYNGKDSKDRKDNKVWLNVFDLHQNGYNNNKEYYRDVLVHEFTHAIDPRINYHKTENTQKDYDSTSKDVKKYLSHDTEVIAQSTTFFNRIIRSVESLTSKNDLEILDKLDKALDSLLQAFATNKWDLIMTTEFNSLMRGVIPSELISFLEKSSRFFERFIFGNKRGTPMTSSIVDFFKDNPIIGGKLDEFWVNWSRILLYKEYNPKAWKSFLTKLYHTVQEAKEIVNKKRGELTKGN